MAYGSDSSQSPIQVAVDKGTTIGDVQLIKLIDSTPGSVVETGTPAHPFPTQQTHGKAILSGPIDFATSGNHTLVAAVGGKTVKVLAIFFVCSVTNVIQFFDTAGSPLELTGAMSFSAQGGLMLPMTPDPNIGYFKPTGVGQGLVMSLASAQQVSGGFVAVQE